MIFSAIVCSLASNQFGMDKMATMRAQNLSSIKGRFPIFVAERTLKIKGFSWKIEPLSAKHENYEARCQHRGCQYEEIYKVECQSRHNIEFFYPKEAPQRGYRN
ncbi:MAG: hypothetical protein NWE78_07025 [Candidatus Bathyarchaeota archaeon]|nr:hypothetical protein [Candidatus Bathyarchaeota archaeon]